MGHRFHGCSGNCSGWPSFSPICSGRLSLRCCSLVGSASQPFANVWPVEPKITPTAENRQRRPVVPASAPALLIHPANSDLQPLGQLSWCQNILRFHPVFTRGLHAVISRSMRLVCQGYVTVNGFVSGKRNFNKHASRPPDFQIFEILCKRLVLVVRLRYQISAPQCGQRLGTGSLGVPAGSSAGPGPERGWVLAGAVAGAWASPFGLWALCCSFKIWSRTSVAMAT
jgi:hypothetical protein